MVPMYGILDFSKNIVRMLKCLPDIGKTLVHLAPRINCDLGNLIQNWNKNGR